MLSDIIAPDRLRAGDPHALAALVAVGGWSVVAYCERAGAGDDAARAVVLTFVSFRRRAIQAGADADLERILLDSAGDAVDAVRGDAPTGAQERSAEEAFARASPRPLSARLATQTLHALVDSAPVDGDRDEITALAECAYAAAYEAAEPAPAIAGEHELGPASALLRRAADGTPPEPAPEPAAAPAQKYPPPAAVRPPRRDAAAPAIAARLAALSPARRALAFAGALVTVVALIALLGGASDDEVGQAPPASVTAAPQTVTVTQPATTTAASAAATRAQILRGTPRRPLTASGARFEVVPISQAGWARAVRDEEPRRGTSWITVAVRTRNIDRRDLVLRTLGYRLRTEGGVIIGPRVLEVAEGPQQARGGPLPRGARASVHLGFEVPFDAGRLSIAFEPGGLGEPTVLVAL